MSSVSLILPAYNEASTIRSGALAEVTEWGQSQTQPVEIIFVDDGSQDETLELLKETSLKVLKIPHGGKAAAIRAGFEAASGQFLLFADLDQATPIREASRLVDALENGADVVMGSRGFRRQSAPLGRKLMSFGHWALCRALLGLPWRDTLCGFKGFRRSCALDILSRMRVYGENNRPRLHDSSVTTGFDVELLLIARQIKLDIREVPVEWTHKETQRVRMFKESWRSLKDLWAISVELRRGAYK